MEVERKEAQREGGSGRRKAWRGSGDAKPPGQLEQEGGSQIFQMRSAGT